MFVVSFNQPPRGLLGWLIGRAVGRGEAKATSKPSPDDEMRAKVERFMEEHRRSITQDGPGRIVETPPADGLRLCPCGCNRRFEPRRKNQKYFEDRCRKRVWAAAHPKRKAS